MPEQPERRFFQLHLSTAIVLMFAVGGLMWANIQPDDYTVVDPRSWGTQYTMSEFGWPLKVYWLAEYTEKGVKSSWPRFSTMLGIINACINVSIVIAIWFVCERKLKRYSFMHPATAILLLITTAVIIWLNSILSIHGGRSDGISPGRWYGWPYSFNEDGWPGDPNPIYVLIDLAAAIFILFLVFGLAEFACSIWTRFRRRPPSL